MGSPPEFLRALFEQYEAAEKEAHAAMLRKEGVRAMLHFQTCKTLADVIGVYVDDPHWTNLGHYNQQLINQHLEMVDAHDAFKAMGAL